MAARAHQRCTRNEKEPKEGIALDCAPCPVTGAGGALAALALGAGGYASRCRASGVSREPPAAAAVAAPAGPRVRWTRGRGDDRAVAPARRARAPGSGQGRAVSPAGRVRVGWGWETYAMRLRMQRIWHRLPADFSRREKASGDLGKPLSPACDGTQGGSLSLLFRALCLRPPGHFGVTGLSRRERVASPVLPGVFRYSAPRSPTFVVEFESPPQDPVGGLPG
jgi:hypothetical protein